MSDRITMSAAEALPELLRTFERTANRFGELWERCQGKGWPEAESAEFHAIRDERLPAMREKLRAALAAAAPNPAGQWQPIETAPKDGRLIVLGARNGVWLGKHQPVFQSGYVPDNPWSSMLLNHDHMAERYTRPTHWMPLPAAPGAHPAPTEVAEYISPPGLCRVIDDDEGILRLQFRNEEEARAFMHALCPNVDIREAPPLPDDAPMLSGLTASETEQSRGGMSAQERADLLREFHLSAQEHAILERALRRSTKIISKDGDAKDDWRLPDRIRECAQRLVEHADFRLGGNLSASSKASEIPSKATSQVKARHLAALRDALDASETAVRICPEKDTECGTHLCAACPKRTQGEVPAEPSAPVPPPHVKSVLVARCETAIDSIEAMLGGRNGPSIQLRAWVRELSTVDGGPPAREAGLSLTDEQIDVLTVDWADAPAAVRQLGDGRTAEFWSISRHRMYCLARAILASTQKGERT